MAVVVVASARPAVAAKHTPKASVPKVFSKEQKVCCSSTCNRVLRMLQRQPGRPGSCCSSTYTLCPYIDYMIEPCGIVQLAIAGVAASIATTLAPAAQAAQEVAMTAEVRPRLMMRCWTHIY